MDLFSLSHHDVNSQMILLFSIFHTGQTTSNNMIFFSQSIWAKIQDPLQVNDFNVKSMHPADRTNSVHQPDLELLEGKHSILSSRNGNKPKCALLPNVWPFILFPFPTPPSHLRGLYF